ncbi:MAG: hypothetical protein PHY32_03095 [Candidatus Pacebacteria bacterium]|jgi:hypothetical protein|nr:hypothetical protein [Candidatus Paceibacterota bacterium]
MDCNYLGSNPPSDLTFVGHGLPKKSAGGSQDNGSVTDKIKIEASLTEAKQGDIFNIKHVGGKILDNASCY